MAQRTEEEKRAARERSNANLMTPQEVNARKTPEERRESASKAGKASAEAKKRRKTAREIYEAMLSRPASDQVMGGLPDLPEGATNYDVMLARMMFSAQKGSVKAAQFVRDTAGDQPTTKVEADIGMTDGDRALLEKVAERIKKDSNQ
ncbi:MAG TPA: hypothetical protein H9776_06015 [Candidatus Mediterraneibacter intestinipullorum]|nr:hypothetical protein [Candidatus Mediterraneibacter intestinipullorum]